jgi:hypothetical protein
MQIPDMSPEHLAQTINRSLHRLPLVLEVLAEIHGSKGTYPGDHEMRHGAEQAVATMVQHLKRIDPVPSSPNQSSESQQIAQEWLRGNLPERVLPHDLHQELATVLSELVPTARQ